MSGHQVAEEEELHLREMSTLNRSTLAVNLATSPHERCILLTSEIVGKPSAEQCPPVSLAALLSMESQMSPPPLDICHELLFDPKVKLFLKDFTGHNEEQFLYSGEYWTELREELERLKDRSTARSAPTRLLQQLLYEIRDMLVHLYPESSHLKELLLPGFDVPCIVELIRIESQDVEVFLKAFCAVIKANCAPKRDAAVENIMRLGSIGDWTGFFHQSLDLMKLMKMDLINYRLSCNRNKVLANLVSREFKYFQSALKLKPASVWTCQKWFQACNVNPSDNLHDSLQAGYLDIIFGTSQVEVPDTFLFDRKRIFDFQKMIQKITILGSAMLIFSQAVGKKCRAATLLETKIRLSREISKLDGHVSEIASQILLVASREQGTSFNGKQRQLLMGLVDRIMDPASPVYQKVSKATRRVLELSLGGKKVTSDFFKRSGIELVQADLEALIPHVKLLWSLHWRVHQNFYTALLP